LTVYEPYGQYQLVAYAIQQSGAGELEAAFRKMKEKLLKEGLFDADQKKTLPRFPRRIAVVTSPTGAAIRDILSTLRRRWPALEVVLCPVRVQGDQAAGEIVRALETLARVDDIDTVIVGRGGGSLEDLWAFNEEAVARAMYRCPLPIVSAVGHETDFTIADFVADVRAATPTMAAELAVPLAEEVMTKVGRNLTRLAQSMAGRIETRLARLQELLRSYALGKVRGRIEHAMQTHDLRMEALRRRVFEIIRTKGAKLAETIARLEGLDTRAILQRGFTLCSDEESGRMLRSAVHAAATENVRITFHDGDVLTRVKEKRHERRQG
jgi:exodeoxyribonuclease VII large subunit